MAIRVGVGVSVDGDPLQAAREAARGAKLNLATGKIDLAVVFSSIEYAHSTVLKTISSMLGVENIVGCSGLGIITGEGIFKRGLAVMLINLPADIYLNTACVRSVNPTSSTYAGKELGEKLSYGFKNIRRHLSVIFSDGLIEDGSGLLHGLQEKFGRSFPIAGASASDNLAFKRTYQYFGTETLSDSACGILWGGKLNFGLGIHHGWKPLGKPRQVTKSSANTVYEIDAAPAADMYKEYFASDIPKLRKELKRISIFYPIGIYLPGEEEYLLRNLSSIEDNGALVFQGDVPKNSRIRLMIGTKESCLSATSRALDEVKNGLGDKQCDFAFVFDSVSRYILLGRQVNEELRIIKEKLGKKTPFIGLYTYGEQAPLESIGYHGVAHFHNQTIAVLGVGG